MNSDKLKLAIVPAMLLAVILCPALMAQQAQKLLTNADVVKMVKGGLPESVILSEIKSSPSIFDLSPDALIHLHRAGISKRIMDAMMSAGSKEAAPGTPPPSADNPPPSGASEAQPQPAPAAAAPPPAASPAPTSMPSTGLPSVAFLQGDAPQPIALERTALEETRTKPSSMLSLASDSALAPVIQGEVGIATGQVASHIGSGVGAASLGQAGGMLSGLMAHRKPTQTYVWAVPNPASSNVLPTRSPVFAVDFSNVPGVNPSEYEPAIVKLTPAQNAWRLVGATQGKDGVISSSALDWQIYAGFLEDRVGLRPQKTAPGQYRISPAAPLLPGEYAVVLRPISKSKKFSGADVARDQGDGMIFDSAWSFQVPPDAQR